MRWVSAEAVRAVLARDPNRPGAPELASLDDSEIESAVDSAQAEVEARTAGVYPPVVTAAEVPRLLVDCCVDIAAYLLVLRYTPGELSATDVVTLRHQRAVDLLKGLASGLVDLPTRPDAAVVRGQVLNPYEGCLFGPESWGLTEQAGPYAR